MGEVGGVLVLALSWGEEVGRKEPGELTVGGGVKRAN